MKSRISLQVALLSSAFILLPAAFILSQGPLTPPGAPAPTMKTLDQVEPRKPIDANNTPGDGTNSFRITAPGSYYLTGNITGAAGKNGISVEASDVTIDLRGFTLSGVPASLDGIFVAAGSSRLKVCNGNIQSWDGDGVDEVDGSATNGIYQNVRATGNSGDGLRLGDKVTVSACKLSGNTVYGMTVNGMATINGCTVENNSVGGILIGSGSILDTVASQNGDAGIQSTSEPVLMKRCVSFENGTGFRTSDGGNITDCTARFNFVGIEANSYSTITNCTLKNNNGTGILANGSCHITGNMCEGNSTGIETGEDRNLIKGNQVINGDTGIRTLGSSTNNLILGNTASNNGTNNYDISADNRHGPVVDITAPGTPAVPPPGNTGPDTTTTTHPWANFAY